jgi:hypothetical protein
LEAILSRCSICNERVPNPCSAKGRDPATCDQLVIPPRQPLAVDEELPTLATQVGGTHYTDMVIQPMTYSMVNGLDACQHTIIKYVSRFRAKNGIEDLEKAKHCIDLLIEFERKKNVGA